MSTKPNPYERPQSDHPDLIIVKGDTEEWKSYKIEYLLNKCQCKYGWKIIIKYLVKWKGYSSEFDK